MQYGHQKVIYATFDISYMLMNMSYSKFRIHMIYVLFNDFIMYQYELLQRCGLSQESKMTLSFCPNFRYKFEDYAFFHCCKQTKSFP